MRGALTAILILSTAVAGVIWLLLSYDSYWHHKFRHQGFSSELNPASGAFLDLESGMLALYDGRCAILHNAEGRPVWINWLAEQPQRTEWTQLESDSAEFSSFSLPEHLAAHRLWDATLSPVMPAGYTRCLALTVATEFGATRSRDAEAPAVTALVYDYDSRQLIAELDLTAVYADLTGNEPNGSFLASLRSASRYKNGDLLLCMFFHQDGFNRRECGVWSGTGYQPLFSRSTYEQEGLLAYPEGKATQLMQPIEIFDLASAQPASVTLGNWYDARRDLLGRAGKLLILVSTLAAAATFTLSLFFSLLRPRAA